MEEIVTIDGRQFQLTIDRPLTVSERQQVIADIRKQTGCGTCGGKISNMGGKMQSLAPTCTRTTVSSDPAATPASMTASPDGGVAPYTVTFYIQLNGDPIRLDDVSLTGDLGGGAVQQTVLVDAGTTTAVTYRVSDADLGLTTGSAAVTDWLGSGITVPLLPAATVRFLSHTVDSCTGTGGPKHCAEWCDMSIVCPTPTCNFNVT